MNIFGTSVRMFLKKISAFIIFFLCISINQNALLAEEHLPNGRSEETTVQKKKEPQDAVDNNVAIDEIGPPEPCDALPADLDLIISRERPVVGELWTVFGKITNRSDRPIWIADRFSTLSFPPEISGASSRTGAKGAFFPTTVSKPDGDEISRIDPNKTYYISWKMDPFSSSTSPKDEDKKPQWNKVLDRISNTVKDFLFFRPGEYNINANVHIWPRQPKVKNNHIANFGESFIASSNKSIYFESSPWVLILGAASGGLLCFFIRLLYAMHKSKFKSVGGIRYLLFGPIMAILLCSTSTILISRVSATDFLFSIKVQDIWGSFAIGFILQWLGLSYFSKKIQSMASEDSTQDRQATEHDLVPEEKVESNQG